MFKQPVSSFAGRLSRRGAVSYYHIYGVRDFREACVLARERADEGYLYSKANHSVVRSLGTRYQCSYVLGSFLQPMHH